MGGKMEQLHTFEIKDQFYLDGNPFRIISGGMHYFRVLPEHWEDRLLKLKALGCNTVETVVPWNLHEQKKGEFDFTGEKLHGLTDLVGYVKLAQKLGLWVILRPSPYICAEWEFGGFPAWLLADGDMESMWRCFSRMARPMIFFRIQRWRICFRRQTLAAEGRSHLTV